MTRRFPTNRHWYIVFRSPRGTTDTEPMPAKPANRWIMSGSDMLTATTHPAGPGRLCVIVPSPSNIPAIHEISMSRGHSGGVKLCVCPDARWQFGQSFICIADTNLSLRHKISINSARSHVSTVAPCSATATGVMLLDYSLTQPVCDGTASILAWGTNHSMSPSKCATDSLC